MTRRIVCVLNLLIVTGLLAFGGVTLAAVEDATTEDVIVMNDHRELRGHIVSETDDEIVFQVVNRKLGLSTTVTLQRENILLLERGVAIPADQLEAMNKSKPEAKSAGKTPKPVSDDSAETSDEDSIAPKRLLVVPMHGQTGTDIHPEIYQQIVDDILAADPDAIIIDMKCADIDDKLTARMDPQDRGYDDVGIVDDYRDLMGIFHKELRDIPQYLWVHDSVGFSSVLALSWDNLYMQSGSRLGGIELAAMNYLHAKNDPNKLGKFREAYIGWLRGLMAFSNRDYSLIDAMIRPEMKLSASFEGREVKFSLDNNGDFIVDNSDKRVTNFTARLAENLLISDGTVDTADDLAFLIGFREYEWVDNSTAKEKLDRYMEDWRRLFDRCYEELLDFEENMGWASGRDTVMYLGRAKKNLQNVLNAMNRYKAVEIRVGRDYGISKIWLVQRIEILNEQIRRSSTGGSGRTRGGGGDG